MFLEIPDHYAANVGGALVHRAAEVIDSVGFVPSYLHQFADLWEKGLHFGGSDVDFWTAVSDHSKIAGKVLRKQGLV